MTSIDKLFIGIALAAATAGVALSVSCATSVAGPNDKYVHPAKPITDPVKQRAFVCSSFDRYGVRSDVIDGMLHDLASWGRSSFTKGVIDAAVYGECPQYMNSYLAVIRERNQSRLPATEADRRPAPTQQAQLPPETDVPNLRKVAAAEAACAPRRHFPFGLDVHGHTYVCFTVYQRPSQGHWIPVPPLIGVRDPGTYCSRSQGTAQSPEGLPLLCSEMGRWYENTDNLPN